MSRLLKMLWLAPLCVVLALWAPGSGGARGPDDKKTENPPPSPQALDARDAVEVLEIQLDVKKAHLEAAKANYEFARSDYQRALEVSKTPGGISIAELDQRKAALAAAQAEVRVKEAETREVEVRLKQGKRRLDNLMNGGDQSTDLDRLDAIEKKLESLLKDVKALKQQHTPPEEKKQS